MPDFTDREIPVLDDIISSPVKTDELLADAKINDEPEVLDNIQLGNVQLDIELDEPSLATDTHFPPAHEELTEPRHNLTDTEHENHTLSDSRIEPAVHHAEEITDTFEDKAESSTDEAENTSFNFDNYIDDTSNDLQNTEQQTLTKEDDDPDILPSGERLYRYIPETPAQVESEAEAQTASPENTLESAFSDTSDKNNLDVTPAQALATEDEQTTQSSHQEQSDVITENNDESPLKTDSEIKHIQVSDDLDSESGQNTEQSIENSITPVANQGTGSNEHESALIDYQTDVDPYCMDDIEENGQHTETATDNVPQWQDTQQEINGIQAEDSPDVSLICNLLTNLDTDVIAEQIVQKMLPDIESQLRKHINKVLQESLNSQLSRHTTSSSQ